VLLATVQGLGHAGTRLSLERLFALRARGGPLAAPAREAIHAIEERYPMDAALAGGLAVLSGAGDEGALSLALGADEGGLALYESGRAASDALGARPKGAETTGDPAEARSRRTLRKAVTGGVWTSLPAPPRRVPLSVRLTLLTLGDEAKGLLGWGLAALGVVVAGFAGQRGLISVGLALAGAGMLFRAVRRQRTVRLLRDGRPGFARLVERERLERRQGDTARTYYRYRYALAGEDGREHVQVVERPHPEMKLEDEHAEPALYTLDEAGHIDRAEVFDALPGVRLDRRGRLRAAPSWVLRALLGPLVLLVALWFALGVR
jgi:hypothetical protein